MSGVSSGPGSGVRSGPVSGTGVRPRVDWPACTARGLCAEMLPELVRLDEWGYPVLADGEVPAELLKHARDAVQACPKLAFRLVKIA